MNPRLLFIALAALSACTTAAEERGTADQNGDEIAVGHLSRLRSVFHEAYTPQVLLSAIVYASSYPENMVGLRRSGDAYEIFAVWTSQRIYEYALIEMLRSRAVAVLTLHRGGRTDDRSDEEADRLAATLPADPIDLQLTRCSFPIDSDLARTIVTAWQDSLLRLPREAPTGSPGIYPVYLVRAANEEREVVYSQWRVGEDTPDQHLMEIADALYLDCRTENPDGAHIRETLANLPHR